MSRKGLNPGILAKTDQFEDFFLRLSFKLMHVVHKTVYR